ncbi:MAG: hypothetical protein PUC59_09075 [Firmicutes bacterium]|nr:hypothetical protein [Bacillota bacterium]
MKKQTLARTVFSLAMVFCFVFLAALPSSGAEEAPAAAAEETSAAAEEQTASRVFEPLTAEDYKMWGFYDDAKAQELEKDPEPGAVYSTLLNKCTFEYFQADIQKYLAEHENDPDEETVNAIHVECERRAYEDVLASGLLPPGFDPSADPEIELSDIPVITDGMTPEEQELTRSIQSSMYALYLMQQEQKRCAELQIDLSPEELEAFIEEAHVFMNSNAVEIADDGQLSLMQEGAEIPQSLQPVLQQVCAEQPEFLSAQTAETAE